MKEEIEEELSLRAQHMNLKDRSQKYFNMLTCIHTLSDLERELLHTWMIQTDELISTLPPIPDAEVAFHP